MVLNFESMPKPYSFLFRFPCTRLKSLLGASWLPPPGASLVPPGCLLALPSWCFLGASWVPPGSTRLLLVPPGSLLVRPGVWISTFSYPSCLLCLLLLFGLCVDIDFFVPLSSTLLTFTYSDELLVSILSGHLFFPFCRPSTALLKKCISFTTNRSKWFPEL